MMIVIGVSLHGLLLNNLVVKRRFRENPGFVDSELRTLQNFSNFCVTEFTYMKHLVVILVSLQDKIDNLLFIKGFL